MGVCNWLIQIADAKHALTRESITPQVVPDQWVNDMFRDHWLSLSVIAAMFLGFIARFLIRKFWTGLRKNRRQ